MYRIAHSDFYDFAYYFVFMSIFRISLALDFDIKLLKIRLK